MSDVGQAWGREGRRLVSVAEALALIGADLRPIGDEIVSLSEAAERVLAAPILADDDYPAFDKAMMDGFAVRAADCGRPGARLALVGLAAAGRSDGSSVAAGQAVRINTGAPVPAGADAVVRVEDARVSADGRSVEFQVAPTLGQNVSMQASDRRRGDAILSPPVRLGPGQLAAAASAGAGTLRVRKQVGASLIVTGDELVPAGMPRSRGQIYESNGAMLAALLRRFGARPRQPEIAADETNSLVERLTTAMTEPIVVVVGGMSMGTLDLAPSALESLGVRWAYHGVDMRPGKPTAYGKGPAGQHVFGLPGNPGSAFVCAWLFVRAAVRGLLGYPAGRAADVPGCSQARVETGARDSRPAFVPARAWNDPEMGWVCEPVRWGGSGDPFGLADANALLCRDRPSEPAPAGSAAQVFLIDEIS